MSKEQTNKNQAGMMRHWLALGVLVSIGAGLGCNLPVAGRGVSPADESPEPAQESSAAPDEGGASATLPPPAQPGEGPTLAGCAVFPADNIWNVRVDSLPLDPNSDRYVAALGKR